MLAMFCIPSGLTLYQNNQLQVIENEIIMAIKFARNSALLEGVPLTLTPLPHSTDWSEGMILFTDNKAHQYKEPDQIIHQWRWKYKTVKVGWKGFLSTHYLIFSPQLDHSATSGHFIIQTDNTHVAQLVVNRFGRVTKHDII